MILARKLLDNFIDNLDAGEKEVVYQLAVENLDLAMAKMAIRYEEIYRDYPTGFISELIMQHLKDKVFQKRKNVAA